MENAVDALIMAGQALMFIVALSICMSSFSTLRTQADEVLGTTDTIRFIKEGTQYKNFITAENAKSNRVVGAETVVASMYRGMKEDYIIYINFKNEIPEKISKDADLVYTEINGKKYIEITIGRKQDGFNQKVDQILASGFYKYIQGKQFNEYLGEYQNVSESGVTTENKLTKRIITYEEIDP